MTEVTWRAGGGGQIVRTFWHGPPLDPYRLLCLRSFVAQGHRVELFTYSEGLSLPDWIVQRNANDIWPTDRVLRYQSGAGLGNPALHANLFRLALLQRLGGWWIDADVILLRPDLPDDVYFFAREDEPYFNNAVIKFPPRHALLAEAIEYCRAIGETAIWSQTGSRLLTDLVRKYDLTRYGRPGEATCPVPWFDIEALFDPGRCVEVRQRSAKSVFLHLCKQMWHRSGIPSQLAPPQGSFLDELIAELDLGVRFPGRMDFAGVRERFGRTMRAELMQRTVSLEMTLDERTGRLLAVEQTLGERNQRIASLEAALAERDGRLSAIEATLAERDGRLSALEASSAGGRDAIGGRRFAKGWWQLYRNKGLKALVSSITPSLRDR